MMVDLNQLKRAHLNNDLGDFYHFDFSENWGISAKYFSIQPDYKYRVVHVVM